MKTIRYILLTALSVFAIAACDKWTQVESVDLNYVKAWDENPALWERYKESLRSYKANPHYLFYALFDNTPEKTAREDAWMRCLPDSLDYVSLTNAANFSDYDREDMEWMHSIGTKVLYQIDLDKEGLADVSALNTYLDKAVASVKENGLDGWSFTATYKLGNTLNESLASALVTKLSAAKTTGQALVFEGNPMFVPEADRSKVDLYVLDSKETAHSQELLFQVLSAIDYAGVPAGKLLLGADIDGTIQNEEREECNDVEELTRRAVSFGPLGGVGIYNIKSDYYSYSGNYVITRAAIQLLNPSH